MVRVDVVVVTGSQLELDAVLSVDAGAESGSRWERVDGPAGMSVALRSFVAEQGAPLCVAAVLADAANLHALRAWIDEVAPRCLAMCGVCAGRRGRTNLGDVVVAERLVYRALGEQNEAAARPYRLRDDWRAVLERVDAANQFREAAWLRQRPVSAAWRERRALIAICDHLGAPWNAIEPGFGIEDWSRLVADLAERGLATQRGYGLTAEGRRLASELLTEYQAELPDLSPTRGLHPFRLHVASIGSESCGGDDEAILGFISRAVRAAAGLDVDSDLMLDWIRPSDEMDALVMKGVMDFADHGRDAHFKNFAARASAECLLWFLRQPPGAADERHVDRQDEQPDEEVGDRGLLAHVAAGDPRAARELACDLGVLEARCRTWGVDEVEQDLANAAARCWANGNDAVASVLDDLARALTLESHWVRHRPEALAAQLWNRLQRRGWSSEELERLRGARPYVRIRHVVSGDDDALVRDLVGHRSSVSACAVIPDGKRVVSASWDKTLRVWELTTGRTVMVLAGHTGYVNGCAITPDGQCVVSASSDGTLRVWSLADGRVVTTLEGHSGEVQDCAISADGRQIVSASEDRTLKIWDLATGRAMATLEGHRSLVRCCAIAPDGKRIVSASVYGEPPLNHALEVWELATGRIARSLEGHANDVISCAITPDGKHAVSGSWDATLKLWELDTGRVVRTFTGHDQGVADCAITSDGTRVVSASLDGALRVWDLETGCLTATLEGHASSVYCCAITPDGNHVVSGSADGTLKLWNLAARASSLERGAHAQAVTSCDLSPDGKRAVSASFDGTLRVWNAETGELEMLVRPDRFVMACAITADGRQLITAGGGGTIEVRDLDSGRVVTSLDGPTGELRGVTADGRRVVMALRHTFTVWDVPTGRVVATFEGRHGRGESQAVIVKGNRVVGESEGQALRVWDLDTGAVITTFERKIGGVSTLAASPDGKRVLAARPDGVIEIWNLDTGSPVGMLEGHTEWVDGCAVTPDGRRAVSASRDGTIRVWDLAAQVCLGTFCGSADFRAVAVTKTMICAGDAAGTLWFLETS